MSSRTTEGTLLLVSFSSSRCGELARRVNTWREVFCVIVQSTISSKSPQHMKNQDKDARNTNVQAIKRASILGRRCRKEIFLCIGGTWEQRWSDLWAGFPDSTPGEHTMQHNVATVFQIMGTQLANF